MTNKEMVGVIHRKNIKLVLVITGGATEFIGELLRHGGGSNTVLAAIVPYCTTAIDLFLMQKPPKYCSKEAAGLIAFTAYRHANQIGGIPENSIGLGVTCSLTKDNERVGREHNAYIALYSKNNKYALELDVVGNTREEQETWVAQQTLESLHKFCQNFAELL